MVIHFICRGNAFRSIIAEAYLNSLKIPSLKVISSGTIARQCKEDNRLNFPKTLELLEQHGIGQFAKDHYADNVSQDLLDESDIVIFMNKLAQDETLTSFSVPNEAIVWDVIDLGERGRIAKNELEREKYAEDAFQEIIKNVDELVSLNNLASV